MISCSLQNHRLQKHLRRRHPEQVLVVSCRYPTTNESEFPRSLIENQNQTSKASGSWCVAIIADARDPIRYQSSPQPEQVHEDGRC